MQFSSDLGSQKASNTSNIHSFTMATIVNDPREMTAQEGGVGFRLESPALLQVRLTKYFWFN